jgi:dynein heavy chain
MQEDITRKKPILEEMTIEAEALMAKIKKESEEVVQPKKKQIEEEEDIANVQASNAHSIKVECEKELAKAMPLIEKAVAALNTIKPKDIGELKSLGKPPNPIRKVLHAVCVMNGRKAERTPKKDNPKEQEDNWWLTSTKFMS